MTASGAHRAPFPSLNSNRLLVAATIRLGQGKDSAP